MKKWLAVILSFSLILGLLSACGDKKSASNSSDSSKTSEESKSSESGDEKKETTEKESEPEKDGTIKMASLNPFERSTEGASLVFDYMTHLDGNYNAHPDLITEWKANDSNTEFELTIRKGVKFHDGTDLTADIVKWNIEKGGAFNYCAYSYILDSVEVVDEEHIKVKLLAPYLYFEKDLGLVPCIPVDGYTEEGMYKTWIGTGAFKYEGTDEGEVATLVRNEDYWDKDFDTDVKKILWHAIADEQTRRMALESGKVNVLGLTEHYISLPYTAVNELKNKGKFGITKEDDDAYTSVGAINLNWKKGPMSDINLRRFMNAAVDREEIVKNVFFDVPLACGHIYNPKFDDGPQMEKPFEFSMEKAKSYLEAAGYKAGSESSPTTDASGKPLKLDLVLGEEEHQKDLALYLKDALNKWGIELELKSLQGAAKYELLKSGNYDMDLGHPWFVPLIGSLGFMGLSSEYSEYGLGFCVNEEMKAAGDAYMKASDKESAKKYSDQIWKVQYEQMASVPIFGDLRYIIDDKVFKGFHFDGNVFRIDLNGVKYE